VKAALLALLIVLAGWLASGLLMTNDHTLLGIVIGLASLPTALGVWVTLNDRI
jgi:hypothetical protein